MNTNKEKTQRNRNKTDISVTAIWTHSRGEKTKYKQKITRKWRSRSQQKENAQQKNVDKLQTGNINKIQFI